MALWTPAEITTALWLDAADSGTLWQDTSATTPAAATNIVRRWDDKSGNGRNATQSNSGQEPVVDSAAINGLNAVSFDGSNDGLIGSAIWSAAGAGAAFVVYKPKAVTGTFTRAVFGQSSTGSSGTWRMIQYRNQTVTGDPYFAGFSADMTDSVSPTTNTKLAGWTYNGTTGVLYRNGTQTATASLSLNTAATAYTIGRHNASSPTIDYANVQVAEIVALTSMPSTDTRQLIEGYLAWKWGLEANLPSGHPYEFAAPTTGVEASGPLAGIEIEPATGSAAGTIGVIVASGPMAGVGVFPPLRFFSGVASGILTEVEASPVTGQVDATIGANPSGVLGGIQVRPPTGRGLTGANLNRPTYRIVRDPYRDPIFKNGKVILSRPLEPGQRLSIERRTPQFASVPIVRDRPFPAEGFEYEMDKLTFIQQEIEGTACDCRRQDIEDIFEEEYYLEFPECRPYTCDVFDNTLAENEMLQMRLYSLNTVLANHVNPFAGSAFNGVFVDDGSSVGWNTGGNVASSVLAGSGVVMQPCGGEIERVFRWRSRNVSTRVGIIVPNGNETVNTYVMALDPGSITADADVDGQFMRTARNYLVTRPAGGDVSFRPASVIAFRINSGLLQVEVPQTGAGWVTLGTLGAGALSSGEGVFAAQLLLTNPGFFYQVNTPFTNRYVFTINISGSVSISGPGGTAQYIFDIGEYQTSDGYFDSGQGPPTFILQPNISTTNSYCMLGARFDAWYFGGKNSATPIDISDYLVSFYQNRPDYESPEFCLFPRT
jgi:hypothetical protein